jgi:hypothetical protein
MTVYLYPTRGIEADSDVSLYSFPLWIAVNSDVPDWASTSSRYLIHGAVAIDGEPSVRDIVLISSTTELLGDVTSSNDGSFDFIWTDNSAPVIVLMLDDLGTAWAPDAIYQQGTVIYPSAWNGWQYVCVSGGTGPTDEPTWWAGEGVTAIIGTATFKARQYISAQAHGLIQPIVEEH